jgi:hypothetical protein
MSGPTLISGNRPELLDSSFLLPTDCFEFRRRIDNVIYRFEPAAPREGYPAWKRVDAALWLTWIPGRGWRVVDEHGAANSQPWNVAPADLGPPEGEWLSKKGDKSYVYDLVRLPGPGIGE